MKEGKEIKILHRYITNTANSKEKALIENWIAQSTENHKIVEKTKLVWRLSRDKKDNYEPDVEKGLQGLKNRIREDESGIRVQLEPRRSFFKYVAAAAVLLAAGLFWMIQSPQSNDSLIALETIQGEKSEITLADGTKVWLNESTQLTYPDHFGNERIVELKGEAFFDVAKDATRPFIIKTEQSDITVLGTSFNVRSYEKEAKTTVAVRSGKVRFQPNKSAQKWELTANQRISYDYANQRFNKEEADTPNEWTWHSGQLAFKGTKLKEVIATMEKQFGVKVQLSNTDLYTCRKYTGSFDHKEIEDIVETLKIAFNFRLKQTSETTYVFYGGECPTIQ